VKNALFALALVLLVAATACTGNNNTSSTTATTTPTVARSTDTFTGTGQVRGSDFHSLPVAQAGQVDTTLTVAGPPPTIAMGLDVGSPNGSACVPFAGASANVQAGSAAQLSGVVSAGTICVQVRDIGNATGPVSYTVTVLHP
jgi:hypothetical protein